MPDPALTQIRLSDESLAIVTGTTLENAHAQDMLAAITQASDDGYKRIIVNMKDLEFLSSAGVGSIIGSVELVRKAGGEIILCGLSPTIRHILDVLDLSSLLTISPDQESALRVAIGPRSGEWECLHPLTSPPR